MKLIYVLIPMTKQGFKTFMDVVSRSEAYEFKLYGFCRRTVHFAVKTVIYTNKISEKWHFRYTEF